MKGDISLSILVRWSGERTLNRALSMLVSRRPWEPIQVLNNSGWPFFRVLEQSFHLCALQATTHTLVLDADIVLFPNGLTTIREYVRKHPKYFRIEFQRICKFTNISKGIHLYNNELMLRFGRDYLRSPVDELKPESAAIRRIYEAGHRLVQRTGPFVGWHDYWQWPRHIREKMSMRALRNPELYRLLVHRHERNPYDLDYVHALRGFESGMTYGWDILQTRRG